MSTQVIPSPELHFQFFDANGNPLSGGFLFSYAAGTSTLLNTYADSTGTVLNTNPILLDGSGSPSNGSVQTGIWLINSGYKFVAFDSNMVQQWSVDNLVGQLGLLSLANTWLFPQTFNQPITILATDNQIVTGAVGNQTTLEYPPPSGNIVLSFPNTSDTMVGRNTTDILTNKTLTNPTINTGTINSPSIITPSISVMKSAHEVTITGDTNLHTIYTFFLPGGAMKVSNNLRITVIMGMNANASGNIGVKVIYGGSTISANIAMIAGYISNQLSMTIIGGNLGATNSQTWDQSLQSIGGTGDSYAGHQTTSVDSTVDQNITITCQNGGNTDSITFYRALVEII